MILYLDSGYFHNKIANTVYMCSQGLFGGKMCTHALCIPMYDMIKISSYDNTGGGEITRGLALPTF